MKEILVNYAHYDVWANKLIIEVLCSLSEEEIEKDLGGSFASIKATVGHIWMAENVWLQRLMMNEHVINPLEIFTGSLQELCDEWIKTSEGLLAFTEKIYDDRGLEHEFHYLNLKKELFKSKVWECLHHVFNHSTFHRGQLVTYLRQLGKNKIPSSDFVTFSRLKK